MFCWVFLKLLDKYPLNWYYINNFIRCSGSPAITGVKREPGENPGRSGHCIREAASHSATGFL